MITITTKIKSTKGEHRVESGYKVRGANEAEGLMAAIVRAAIQLAVEAMMEGSKNAFTVSGPKHIVKPIFDRHKLKKGKQ